MPWANVYGSLLALRFTPLTGRRGSRRFLRVVSVFVETHF